MDDILARIEAKLLARIEATLDRITPNGDETRHLGFHESRIAALEKRADEHRRLIDDLDKRFVEWEARLFSVESYIARLETGAAKLLEDKIFVVDLSQGETPHES